MAQGLELYLASNRDNVRASDLYLAARATTGDPFSPPAPLAELNAPGGDSDPWVSEDRRYIVFTSNRSGNDELYEASR